MNKIFVFLKAFISSIKHRFEHKLEHFSIEKLKKALIDGGLPLLPLLIIIVGWEILEDVLFFWALGFYVHPAFYVGIPTS